MCVTYEITRLHKTHAGKIESGKRLMNLIHRTTQQQQLITNTTIVKSNLLSPHALTNGLGIARLLLLGCRSLCALAILLLKLPSVPCVFLFTRVVFGFGVFL